MQKLLDQPRVLSANEEQRLRVLYQQNSLHFSPMLLNPFARSCYLGDFDGVKKAVESGTAPDLLGQETGYKHGYAALALFGAQRVVMSSRARVDHIGTLKYLLAQGAPPDIPDVLGYTPLHHACMAFPCADIARILLEHGASPDAPDVFGSVALMGAFQNESIDAIEVLLEFGARLDIADKSGITPDAFFIKCGPKVTAVVQKWKRKRAGAANPLDEKKCATCAKSGVPLKFCASCHATWYCSRQCQRNDWKKHKHICVPFSTESTVTPFEQRPARNSRSVQVPHIPHGQTKKMIIKVQVPMDAHTLEPSNQNIGNLLVYDKKRSLVCRIRKCDNPEAYMRLSDVVRTQGVMGAKAYFSAEMTSPDVLVVKVSEVLAEQAF
ncbi:ankyrin [Trametes versicolor FP-101664 SS1]|uniref:ankyrin n=1 Tax=Trametes versicolor (strain FP-101664) TaxID=717944 RepID=UPI0004623D90|nr:ankyrin [Trametes versicolor FP-101664 SS1]EIW57994.1 ankyrin [Trametes versicolor FP-101664 SS1]